MSNYTMSPVVNGEKKQMIVKVGDTLPIGTEVDYDGTSVPNGWEQVNNQWTLISNNIYYKKDGNVITIMRQARNDSGTFIQDEITLTGYAYTDLVTTIPSDIRPSTRLAFPIFAHATDNSFITQAYGELQTDGKLSIYNWSAEKVANRLAFCITYSI